MSPVGWGDPTTDPYYVPPEVRKLREERNAALARIQELEAERPHAMDFTAPQMAAYWREQEARWRERETEVGVLRAALRALLDVAEEMDDQIDQEFGVGDHEEPEVLSRARALLGDSENTTP